MDQIANLVIDLSVDAADFKNEVPRVKKLLDEVSGKTDIVTQRQKILLKRLKARAGHMWTGVLPRLMPARGRNRRWSWRRRDMTRWPGVSP